MRCDDRYLSAMTGIVPLPVYYNIAHHNFYDVIDFHSDSILMYDRSRYHMTERATNLQEATKIKFRVYTDNSEEQQVAIRIIMKSVGKNEIN